MEKFVEIEVGPVWSHISEKKEADEILRCRKVWFRKTPFGRMERNEYWKPLIDKGGWFLSGFLPRLLYAFEKREVECDLVFPASSGVDMEAVKPHLPGLRLRDDQKEALEMMLKVRRGVWKAPTGSGKTVLMAALLSAYPHYTSTVLVHTGALFSQTIKEFQGWFPEAGEVGWLGGGRAQEGRIMVCMRQSLVKLLCSDTNMYVSDIVLVDEAHHVSSFEGDYGKILTRLNSKVRIGFTATPPRDTSRQAGNDDQESFMALEGLLGPVIGETGYEELQQKEVLAKPRLKLYRVPDSEKIKWIRGAYKDVYTEGIVKYRRRNALITKVVMEQVEDSGQTVLVLVERVEHGEELLAMFDILMPDTFVFLHGHTDEDKREKEKAAFEKKKRRGVIATRVWAEGVNIKSVGVVVNAVGGESEIACIQRFGRGMRKTQEKEEVLLIDFIDVQHRYFQKHSLLRICSYSEWGWL